MNPHHQTFVNEMILHNDAVRAYKAAYPNAQGEAARTAAHRLMKKEEVRQPIADAYKQLRLGIREDKAAFLHNELKIIDRKRKMLLELMFGTGDITPRHRMMAMKLDNELAAQQAHLLGYGSLKPQYNRHSEQPNQSHHPELSHQGRHLEQPYQGRHSERRERSPEHLDEAETKPVTRPEVGQANRNNKKTPIPSLRGTKQSQDNAGVPCVTTRLPRTYLPSQILPRNDEEVNTESVSNRNKPEPHQDRHSERNDEEENTDPVTNSNNTSPLERQGEVTFPILPIAYASPAENKTVLLL